jgi:hypothetical protein
MKKSINVIPVVDIYTSPIEKDQIPPGIFYGVESSTIPKGGWRGSESEIPKGGWRTSSPVIRDVYRTSTGHLFEFAFYLNQGGYYDCEILSMPDYGEREKDYHSTHRLSSNHGNKARICFGDNAVVSTLEDAKKWAGIWAEQSMVYILDGTEFPNK